LSGHYCHRGKKPQNRVSDVTLVAILSNVSILKIQSGMQQQGRSNALLLHAQGHFPNVLSHWFATDITCLTALIVGALLSSWQETAINRVSDVTLVAISTIAFSKSRQGCDSKAKANALSLHA
jgi:hypothetical protein